jgi:hypothetical protein
MRLDRSAEAFNLANERIGELLRDTY